MEQPLLDLRLLRDRLFRGTVVVIGLSTACFLGMLYLAPIFLQETHHQTPLSSGLTTFVEAFGVIVASQSLAHLYLRVGPRVMTAIGSMAVTALLVSFAFITAHTSLWTIRIEMFLLGGFNSAIFLSVQSSTFTNISRERTGHATAIYTTQRQAAIPVGIAILTSVVTTVHGSQLQRFHAAFIAAATLAALTGVAGITLIRTADALPSMRRSSIPT